MGRYRLDQSSKLPLVHQVARNLRKDISRGELTVGEYLPSVRDLGNELQINFNTVAKAYRLLEKDGLVEIRQGLGARIVETQISSDSEQIRQTLLQDVEDVICQLSLSGANEEAVYDLFAEAIGKHYNADSTGENSLE